MPELPEVETIARNLREGLVGREIVSAQIFWPRSLEGILPGEFAGLVSGQSIREVGRRAKYLQLLLTDFYLFIHLRMSGDLLIQPTGQEPHKHDRVALFFTDGTKLVFNDTRKFGRVWLTQNPEDVIGGLGPEPLGPAFTVQDLYARLQNHARVIKSLLLDQSFVAGLGNIYTDEALHLSGISPLRISDTISLEEAERLHQAIQRVLLSGIEHNGASFDWVYRGGKFQNYFRVYNRKDQPCPVCGTPISRIVVGQRGTHYCSICQE